MNSGNIAVVVLLVIVLVIAGLVYMYGYPLLISVAVFASFAAIALIVVLSLGDFRKKPSRS